MKSLSVLFLGSSLVLFTLGCGQDTTQEKQKEPAYDPKVLKNIAVDKTVDPYEASDYLEEVKYWASLGPYAWFENFLEDGAKPFKLGFAIHPNLPEFKEEYRKKLDDLAKKVDQPYYTELVARSFSRAILDKQGEIIDFLPTISASAPVPAPGLQVPFDRGVTGIIPNQTYLELAKRNFGITLLTDQYSIGGTAWIFDFVPTKDGSYPTHFFFGTNYHVWEEFNSHFDLSSPYAKRFVDDESNTVRTMIFTKVHADNLKVGVKLPATFSEHAFESLSVDLNKLFVRTVFMATDFLESSPKDWTNDPNWKDSEEMADFSVFEVKFTPEALEPYMKKYNLTFEEALIRLTNNYARLESSKRFKTVDPKKLFDNALNLPDKNFYIIGWPGSSGDQYLLNEDTPTDYIIDRFFSRSLMFNKPMRLFKDLMNRRDLEGGWNFSPSRDVRTWMHKPGFADSVLTVPLLNSFETEYYRDGSSKRHIRYGLLYSFDVVLQAGSSGSLVVDSDFNALGLHSMGADLSSNSYTTALSSFAYDYQGYYGKYNLEDYDLIFGGGSRQKNSYRQSLAKLYGKNFVTDLFPEGAGNALGKSQQYKESRETKK